MPHKLFLNLPVKNLDRSVSFFSKLGFVFNAQLTDQHATSMILSDDAYVMLLVEDFFQTFTAKAICDTRSQIEVIVAISADSRNDVDRVVGTALAAGGQAASEPVDGGSTYSRSFHDLDGHVWEVIWMDPSAVVAA
ncbi:MAG TPA: VOC family protein [Acidimicrobiales bacterium]|nr:VOC family protein [Acidimicrobiales bacterium]